MSKTKAALFTGVPAKDINVGGSPGFKPGELLHILSMIISILFYIYAMCNDVRY